MQHNSVQIAKYLVCPDDGSALSSRPAQLLCLQCGRQFRVFAENVLEILPSEPTCLLKGSIAQQYVEGYLKEFGRPFELPDKATPFGAPENVPAKWANRRQRQVRQVLPFLLNDTSGADSVLCDLSAGAGYYTREYARVFRFVLHCDLSVDSLAYARQKAAQLGLKNIFFLRLDYFRPPFRRSLDRLICFDTLIRGEEHEKVLLRKILESLAPGGRAVVDFHNWWHNPLRRVGFLKQNFADNKSYTRSEAERILRCSGVQEFHYQPFYQEFNPWMPRVRILPRTVPPTRLMYRIVA